jgi:Flp pilus assembly protein TadD
MQQVFTCATSRIGTRARIATILAGVAVVGLTSAGVAWRADNPDASVSRQALAAGRYDEAGAAIERWLSVRPDASEAHLLKGRVAVATNRLREAAEELERARALGREHQDLVLLRALIAAKAGRHSEAEPQLARAFNAGIVPDRQVDEALAKTYLETFDLARAATVLDRWARDFPDDARPFLWRAEIHSRAGGGDPRAVEGDYREALRRDPALSRARLGLAEELRKAHRNAEAAAEFDHYLLVVPDDAAAHLGAGRNLVEQGDEAAACRHLERAMALAPNSAEPHLELAESAARQDKWSTALTFLDRAVALDPHDLTARHRRSLALTRLGRIAEARAEQATAARLRKDLDRLNQARSRLIASPDDLESQHEIARWMFDHDHDQEGVRWAEKILSGRPNDPEANRLLAGFYERRGDKGLANFYRLHLPAGTEPSVIGKETPDDVNRP